MDKKLLQLLESDDPANYLLVAQIYGEDNLLKYISDRFIQDIPLDNGIIGMNKITNIAWFSFYKFDDSIWISFDRTGSCICFDSYNMKEIEVILSLLTKKYKEFTNG